MRQIDDYESSTRVCSCGSSITWSGPDAALDEWMRTHGAHDPMPVWSRTSADGERAYAKEKT